MVHAYVYHVTGCIKSHFTLRSHNESSIFLLSVSSETLEVFHQHICMILKNLYILYFFQFCENDVASFLRLLRKVLFSECLTQRSQSPCANIKERLERFWRDQACRQCSLLYSLLWNGKKEEGSKQIRWIIWCMDEWMSGWYGSRLWVLWSLMQLWEIGHADTR